MNDCNLQFVGRFGVKIHNFPYFLDGLITCKRYKSVMARPKRFNLPFCLYHTFSRTNSGDVAFFDSRDYAKFLDYLAEYSDMYAFRIHSYCLLGNHFHLLLESTDRSDLSRLMHRLLTAYTVYFNRRYARHGHLFQGRFRSLIVDKADYLLAVSRYIHLNPCGESTDSTNKAEEYRWSSLRYYLKGNEPSFLHTKDILSWFNGNRATYAQYIREGLSENVKPEVVRQRYIGAEPFAKRMRARLETGMRTGTRGDIASRKREEKNRERDVDQAEECLRKVADYFKCSPEMIKTGRWGHGVMGKARTVLAGLLRERTTWTCSEIARQLALNEKNGVNIHLRRLREKGELTKAFIDILKSFKIEKIMEADPHMG
jgi:putative transposase